MIFRACDDIINYKYNNTHTSLYKENKFMKLAKRVFIGLLAVAVLVSGIAFATSADASAPAYDDILKYYDPETSTIYIDEDFEGTTYEGEVFNGADDKLSSRVEISVDTDKDNNPVNKYLDMISGPITNTAAVGDMLYVVNLNDKEGNPTELGKFVFDTAIKASHLERAHLVCSEACGFDAAYDTLENLPTVCPTCGAAVDSKTARPPVVRVFVSEDAHSEGSIAGTALIVLDFETGKVLRYDGASYAELDFSISEDKWYNIHIVYNQNVFELTITDAADKDNTLVVKDLITPIHSVAAVKVGYISALNFDGRDSVISIDNVYLQSGDDYRKATAEQLEAYTKAALAQLKGMLDDTAVSNDTKFKVIAVYDALVDVYGYTSTDPEVVLDIEAIKAKILDVYAKALSDAVAAINVRNSYEDRLLYVEANAAVAERVRGYIAGEVSQDIIDDLAAYDAEVLDLETDKANSEAFIAFVQEWVDEGYNFYSSEYAVLAEFYNAAKDAYYDETAHAYTYNSTYPGIANAFNNHTLVKNKFEAMDVASRAFVADIEELKTAIAAYDVAKAAYDAVDPADTEALAAAGEALSLAQADRLSAYADARASYYDNTSCPGITEAIEFYTAQTELDSIGALAEDFLGLMAQAAVSINLDAKEDFLDAAEQIIDIVAAEYPGVAEAKVQYTTLRQSILDSRKAAADYIAAVEALEGLTGDALVTAVDNALALKEAGNILEIDGVVDANIELDNIYSSLLYAEASATKFIALVGKIDNEASISERYAAIKAAVAARNVPDKTLSGVSAAEATLDSAISEYNADIEVVNASYAGAAKVAADFSGAPVSFPSVAGYVISFIKSLIS